MPGSVGTQAAQNAAKQKSKTTKSKTSTLAEDTASNPSTTLASKGKTSLSGVPVGTQIRIGQTETPSSPAALGGGLVESKPVFSKSIYTAESVYTIPATLSNQEKANLLIRLASIPGLYAKGQAPTPAYIRSMGDAITLRPQDFNAFKSILTVADSSGQTYEPVLQKFYSNPTLANQYFGKITETPKVIATTAPETLKAELNSRFMDMFDAAPDKKIVDAYIKEVTNLEKKAGAAGQGISSQQREDIFFKYASEAANIRFKTVKGTTDTADDTILEKGALGGTVRLLRNTYADNGIPVQDSDLYKIAIKASRSQQALQNAVDDINMQASVQFPALKDWFSRGKTAKQFFAPYTTAYSKIYGVPEEQVDVSKFYDVASGTSVVPVSQWIKDQWKNPAIKDTQYYKEVHKNDLRAVADAFGMTV